MLLGKVFFSVGLFICVVESAVVVNVFNEDDVKVNAVLPHKVQISSCDMRACDQFCRRLSFASGACLPNGECHCYQYADQSVAFITPSTSPVSHESQAKEIELTKCSPSACNQLCQRLGFKGGVCLSDTTCSCKSQSVDSLLTSSLVSDPSPTKKSKPTKCSPSACNQLCQSLGFKGGICLSDTRCLCKGQSVESLLTASPVSDASQAKEFELTKCSPSACNQLCQKLGFKGGVCLSDTTCSCKGQSVESLLTASPVSDASQAKEFELTKCSPSACNQLCQKLGFKGGVCLSDTTCSCKGQSVESLLTASPVSDASQAKEFELTKCSPSACNQLCQKLGFKGGVCLSDTTCSCKGQSVESLLTASPVSDASQAKEFELTKCSPSACNQLCQSLGFRSGICLSDTNCFCTGQSVDFMPTTSPVSSALQKNSFEVTKCDLSECNQLCQSYGYKGGICLSDTLCLCRVSADSVAIKTEEIELSGCSQPPCKEHCRRLGYHRGICLPNCLCLRDKGNERSTENAYYFYQLADEGEEPKKEVSKVSDCQPRACEQFCRRRGSTGGACVDGSCDCDRFKAKKRNLFMPCDIFECNRMCRSAGLSGGVCTHYGCECY